MIAEVLCNLTPRHPPSQVVDKDSNLHHYSYVWALQSIPVPNQHSEADYYLTFGAFGCTTEL